ncbi:MAG: MerR family transcriptional regulator [Acidimicrobiales bacterium]
MTSEEPALMSIGMFSRASSISVKALRNYHQSGLLIPASVDPATGYRTYHPGQLADAGIIGKLRAVEVPLAEIAEIMNARDPDLTAKVLAAHRVRLETRLDAIQSAVTALMVDETVPRTFTPPYLTEVGDQTILTFTGTVDPADFAPFLDRAYATIGRAVTSGGVTVTGPSGAVYPPEFDDMATVTAFVPVAATTTAVSDPAVRLATLPGRRVAVATHIGPYTTIDDTYLRLGRWVAYQAAHLGEGVRERYTVSYNTEDDPHRFVTEIHWPVAGLPMPLVDDNRTNHDRTEIQP